ncbi:MAG: hypothetical protein ABIG66_00300 [Candidatus Kerfeldbacteria bacterium]
MQAPANQRRFAPIIEGGIMGRKSREKKNRPIVVRSNVQLVRQRKQAGTFLVYVGAFLAFCWVLFMFVLTPSHRNRILAAQATTNADSAGDEDNGSASPSDGEQSD